MKRIDRLICELKKVQSQKKPWETNPYIDIDPNTLIDSMCPDSPNYGQYENGKLVIQAIAFNADKLYSGVIT